MSGEARDKALRDSRVVKSSDALEIHKKTKRKPSFSGGYGEVFNFGSPKARWRQQIFKFGPIDVVDNEQVLTFTGSVPGSPASPVKIEQITVYVETALSESVFVDKVGLVGRSISFPHDDNYFYTGSMTHHNGIGHYVSGAQSALVSGQARAGHAAYTVGDIYRGGWFTGSADITVTFNKAPTGTGTAQGATGSLYLYVYGDKVWKAFP